MARTYPSGTARCRIPLYRLRDEAGQLLPRLWYGQQLTVADQPSAEDDDDDDDDDNGAGH